MNSLGKYVLNKNTENSAAGCSLCLITGGYYAGFTSGAAAD